MKPIKGMNLDVSPDAQPDGTYRIAKNFVYDAEFDGLQQDYGGAQELTSISGKHIIAQYTFGDGTSIVLSTDNANATTGSSIHKIEPAGNSSSLILNDSELAFNPAFVYDITHFEDKDNKRNIIITGGGQKTLVVNVDSGNQNAGGLALKKLFPDRQYPEILQSTQGTGVLKSGTYFFSVRYIMEDGTPTDFGPPFGPIRVLEDGKSITLTLNNVDTLYEKVQVGMIGVAEGAIVTGVVTEIPASATSLTAFVNGNIIGNALLEEIAVLPNTYTQAETIEFHSDNRVYLGNLTGHDESGLQAKANSIVPCYELKRQATGTAPNDTVDDPSLNRFMPGEVYAFYVAWVRDDGSITQAYHIPGRPKTDFLVKLPSGAQGISSGDARLGQTIDVTTTHKELIEATGSGEVNSDGQLSFLKNDRNVYTNGEPGFNSIKYFHTRCTATKFNNKGSGSDEMHHGRLGFWENENEQYPSGFPVGRKYTYNADGTAVSNEVAVTLSGKNVRHHRMPTISWLMDNFSGSTGFDFDSIQEHGIRVRFDFVEIPAGYKGALIYHAKRDNQNNTVISHAPLHFGSANHWAWFGEGGNEYKGYSTVSVVNARNANAVWSRYVNTAGTINDGSNNLGNLFNSTAFNLLNDAAGDPRQALGNQFAAADFNLDGNNTIGTTSREAQSRLNVHFNKGLAYPQDLLAVRPTLPDKMYTTFEYMLIQMEHFANDVEGATGGSNNGRSNTMEIDSDNEFGQFYADVDNENGVNKSRRFLFDFTTSSGLKINQSFPQSRVLPMRNQRYMPAGVVDDEVKFDNRKGAEAFYWDYENISNTASPYTSGLDDVTATSQGAPSITSKYHNAGDRLWWSVLNTFAGVYGDTPSGNTDSARYQRTVGGTTYNQDGSRGFLLQCMPTTQGTLAVQRLPFVSFMAQRFNCYLGFSNQDLVLCTPLITSANTVATPDVEGAADSRRTIPSTRVFGDVRFSKTQYRVTSSTGYNVGFSNNDANNLAFTNPSSAFNSIINSGTILNENEDGTRDNFRGVLIGLFKVNAYSGVSYNFHNKDKPQYKEKERESLMREVSPNQTNDMTLNQDFLRLNNWLQPPISDGVTELDFKFDYRVARSKAQDPASDALNLRTFPALDFVEQTRTRGVIKHLQSYGDKLLIHHEDSLFISVGKESIQTSTGAVVLGSGDIFRVKPTELLPTEYGFAGTNHLQSCTLTPGGYFFVDEKRRRVFMYDGKLTEISNKGMRKWFQDHLQLSGFINDKANGNVATYQPGMQAEYDPVGNRVILQIRNNELIAEQSYSTQPQTFNAYYSSSEFNPKDRVISYSLHNNTWVSLHDLPYNLFGASATKFYGFRAELESGTIRTRRHHLFNPEIETINYITDFKTSTKGPAQIDIAFPANEPVQWQSFTWHTKAQVHKPSNANFGHYDLNTSFDKAAVYNDYQCSGDLTFTKASAVDITNVQQVTLRHNGTRYAFNGFRDLVNDRTARFLDPDYNFVTTNINASKNWYDQRRFKSTHAVLRLISTLDTTKRLYLYDVDAKVRKSYR